MKDVRVTVFVQEQNVPVDLEMDDRDEHCVHVLARQNREPVGTGRIDIQHQGKIGRLAVLQPYRHLGIGRAMMTALEAIAQQAGLTHVWLNAQISAQSFYQKQGYVGTGDTFLEADIVHCRMVKTLEGMPRCKRNNA
ncbi:MAG: GNAT family N-acetyltransferase [Phycisphaeraceae bacterium]|nr:GNAT family N-acetyltransferase [Phycisphaeraceae bacterium]